MRWTAISDNKFLCSKYTLLGLFALLAIVSAIINRDSNNYDIYCGVFRHTIDGTSLFQPYPAEYHDMNHYGPFFSIVIAPFALLPRFVGLILWHLVLALFYYFSIRKSTFPWAKQLFVLWFCANELYTALSLSQFNIITVGLVLFSYYFIEKEQDHWAALCIVIGTFVKIYGIVGLAFFFFSHHKRKLILSLFGWSIVCFCLPMFLSSPEYVLSQYSEWRQSIFSKHSDNMFAFYQNISALGIVRKVSGNNDYADAWIIIPAMLMFLASYLRIKQFGNVQFRQTILASILMFVVLFSSGSESCSYIIALTGVVIWYFSFPRKRNRWDLCLLIFAFIVTSLSPTDIFPRTIRKELIQPYALKALPILLIWLKLCIETYIVDYKCKKIINY